MNKYGQSALDISATMFPLTIIFTILVIVLSIIFFFSRRKLDYWSKQKNIAHLKPVPFLGNYGPYVLQRLSLAETAQRCCQQHPDEPLVGAFCLTEPVLLVQDPEYIKLVMTKDFYYFSSRETAEHTHKELMTRNLFFSHGDHWRVLRQNLTPLFTSAKMKNMFYLIENCSRDLEKMLDREAARSNVVEVRSLMARFTMNCICSAAFGINPNTMEDSAEENIFKKIGEAFFDTSAWFSCKVVARSYWPNVFYALGLKLFPIEAHERFSRILSSVFESRNFEPSSRNDLVDLLLSLKKDKYITGDTMKNLKEQCNEKVSIDLDDELLMAQCMIFFTAGFETSATSLGFTLFALAKHPESQEKVLEEVDKYFTTRDQVEYDCVRELPYLKQCIDEASRLYPVLGVILRETHETYTFPNGVRMEKGTRVHIPVYHIHRNPKYFPDPEEFKPERFSPENKQKIVPYTFMPFGDGPRVCIGKRFARMQMMSGLVTLLKKYKVELADDMPRTLRIEPRAVVSASDTGIWLKLVQRDGWPKRVYGWKSQ